MRAAVFEAPGRPLVLADIPELVPGEGEALIRVSRCGICGSDLHFTERHAMTMPAGTVLGHEYSGEVVALGPGCSRLKVGDRVIAMPLWGCSVCDACRADRPVHCAGLRPMLGGFAEYARIGEAVALRLPPSVSFAEGALVEPLASALHGCDMADIGPASRVLVLGAGAIASGAVLWARRLGAGRIAVLGRSSHRASLIERLGADAMLTGGEDELARVRDVLGGSPDVVLEATGAPGMIEAAVAHVAPMGRVVSLGMCMHRDSFVPVTAQLKEVQLRFAYAYGARAFRECLDLVETGSVAAAMISATVPLEDLPDMFEGLRGGGRHCKVQVAP